MLICDGFFFIVGLVALIAGKFRLYGKRTVQGTRARVVGLILMVPGPLAFLMGLVLGASGGSTPEAVGTLSVFEVLMLVAAFVFAAIVTLTTPEVPTATAPSSVSTLSTSTSPASEDSTQKLKKLKEMLDSSLITTQEYEAKKAEILSKM